MDAPALAVLDQSAQSPGRACTLPPAMMKGAAVGATAGRTWSTNVLPEPEQFPFWRDVVWEAFCPVSLTRRDEGPFSSSVSSRRIGPIGVAQIRSQAQSVVRTSAQVERDPGDVFFVNVPLTPGTGATQHCRTARLGSGDFVVVDSTRPFVLDFEQPFDQVSLILPHELLAPLLAAPQDATAVRVPGDRGVGAIAVGAMRSLAAAGGPFDSHAARALGDQLAALVALALGGVRAPIRSASRALLLQAALDEIACSLGDPGLAPAIVAQSIGVSTRYLHRLFSDRGTSFCRWVLARRLERCHRDLSDPARSHWTIAQIACEWGFTDPAYFARAFKRRYGINPRRLRPPPSAATVGVQREPS